ncbi:MAG: type II toxin-antitoxin system prevent-host-death family antitoxin [Acidobacteria bacterium]|nr:type II toxin-antitoxin system prevent-host-death family antitoxin [Acidobacteriota bacterium]
MTVRNISAAKAQLSALVEAVLKGDDVILAKAGKPVARIVPYRGPSKPRQPGALAGKIWIADDFDSLPGDIAEAFGMDGPKK